MNITLIGMSGAGKSFIGKKVAETTGLAFIDIDAELENEQQMTLRRMIEAWGDERFIEEETRLVIERTTGKDSMLISTGGSIIYSPLAMSHLRNISGVVYLKAPTGAIIERIANLERVGRLVGIRGRSLEDLIAERLPLYEKYAHHIVDAGTLTIEETVAAVAALAGE